MEASSAQQYKEKEQRVHRPWAFDKMEGLVREMQDPENGVPVRSQKLFLTSIPSAFMGYDLIEWLMERLNIEESVEAVHLANQLCQYGYFFPVNDSRTLTVKDDSSLYRFQTPYYWPWQHRTPDNVEYAIYLAKRTLRNKQRHGLEEYELEALTSLKRNLQNKWDIIQLQAEEQVRLSKERKKGDKIVSDSQERAFWRVYRPPPGCTSSLEVVPVPTRARPGQPRAPPRKRTLNDLQREVELLRNSVTRTRIKVSVAVENLKSHFETYMEYDPMISQPLPSNPWITDDQSFWQLNSALVEVPTDKRVKRWGLSMEEVMSDPTGLQEFTNYLRKEYSHENIRFWLAVKDLRHSFQAKINDKVNEIFREFLAPGAPCEINIDGKTMEKVHQEMKSPSRFTFDSAAEHVYTLLLKKDCYPRFIRSDHYRNLLASGIQPLQKKRFFNFGGQAKKKTTPTTTTSGSLSQQQQQQHGTMSGVGTRRRGSDRSLSGSAHELAVCGVRDTAVVTPRVPHSHSQSNLTDIPYRGDLHFKIPSRPSPPNIQDAGVSESTSTAVAVRPMDDVCPWDEAPSTSTIGRAASAESTSLAPAAAAATTPAAAVAAAAAEQQQPVRSSRKNSSQLDSCSSSSDVSVAIAEVSERLRKTGAITERSGHHHPHHHHHHQHQQQQKQQSSSASGASMQRNYSVGSSQPSSSVSSRVKLAETTRASVSTCNFPSPQQSFDLSYIMRGVTETLAASSGKQLHHQAASVAEITPTRSVKTVFEETEQQQQKQPQARSSAKAPLISISAIVGDLPEDLEPLGADDETMTDTPDTSSDCALMSEPLTQAQSIPEVDNDDLTRLDDELSPRPATPKLPPPPAPPSQPTDGEAEGGGDGGSEILQHVREDVDGSAGVVDEARTTATASAESAGEPDTQLDKGAQQQGETSEQATAAAGGAEPAPALAAAASQEQRDNKVNEVCPWEDEENCRVDAPYVKTYATLGYL